MALLSSVFGTALGAAAKVGSEAIRESRESDRLAKEEFKKNIQAKKEAYAKQQAAAQKEAAKVNEIARFLSNQEGYGNFNSVELNDLAKSLITMAGSKDPATYFQETAAEGKLQLIPKAKMGKVDRVIGQVRVGPPDMYGVGTMKEDISVKVDERMSNILAAKRAGESTKKVLSQTENLLDPVKKKPFLAAALAGSDSGTLQRKALQEIGMTEEQYNSMMLAVPRQESDVRTAGFSFRKIEEPDDHMVQFVLKTDEDIRQLINKPENANLTSPSNLIDEKVGEKKVGPPDMYGRGTMTEDIYKKVQPGLEYLKMSRKYNALKPEDKIKIAEDFALVQENFLNFRTNLQQSQDLDKAVKALTSDDLKAVKNLAYQLKKDQRDKIDFDKRLTEIFDIERNMVLLRAEGNITEAINQGFLLSDKVAKLRVDARPQEDKINLRNSYKEVIARVTKLSMPSDRGGTFGKPGDEAIVFGTSTTPSLSKRLRVALETGNTQELDRIDDIAGRIARDLNFEDPSEAGKKGAEIKTAMIKTYMRENNLTDNSQVPQAVLDNIDDYINMTVLRGGKLVQGEGGWQYQTHEMDSETGEVSMVMTSVPLKIDGVRLAAGIGQTDVDRAKRQAQKYIEQLGDLATIYDMISEDGLLLGTGGDIRRFFANFSDNVDSATLLLTGKQFFGNLDETRVTDMLEITRRVGIKLIAGAKDELFDDPRLSDRDLALVIKYIGILNQPDVEGLKLIGQRQAIAAIVSLERIFAKQRAKALMITQGLSGRAAYSFDDFDRTSRGDVFIKTDRVGSFARERLIDAYVQRGIDINKFGNFDDDGEFIGLNRAAVDDAFDNNGYTYGFAGPNTPLDGDGAKEKFFKDISAANREVHLMMSELSQFGVAGNANFRARSRTAGTYGEITQDSKAIKEQEKVLESLTFIGKDGRETNLLEKFRASGRTLYGVKT